MRRLVALVSLALLWLGACGLQLHHRTLANAWMHAYTPSPSRF